MSEPRRLSSTDRMEQILDVAEQQVLAGGLLSLNMQRLGEAVGASRTLIYSYFQDDAHLTGALLQRHVGDLLDRGLAAAAVRSPILDAARDCARIYLAHVVAKGPLLDAIQRDLAGFAIEPTILRPLLWQLGRLARTARRELDLAPHEALSAIIMLTAIPEELGRLVWSNRISRDTADHVLDRLVAAGVDSLRPMVRPGTGRGAASVG